MTAAARVRARLAVARSEGVPFDEAWPDAVADALATETGVHHEAWASGLEAARSAFRRAYLREPAGRGETGVAASMQAWPS